MQCTFSPCSITFMGVIHMVFGRQDYTLHSGLFNNIYKIIHTVFGGQDHMKPDSNAKLIKCSENHC